MQNKIKSSLTSSNQVINSSVQSRQKQASNYSKTYQNIDEIPLSETKYCYSGQFRSKQFLNSQGGDNKNNYGTSLHKIKAIEVSNMNVGDNKYINGSIQSSIQKNNAFEVSNMNIDDNKYINDPIRSTVQKNNAIEISNMNASITKKYVGSSQSQHKQRTYSAQICENLLTDKSQSQANQSLDFGIFSKNRMRLLSIEDEPISEINEIQPKLDDSVDVVQDCFDSFKKQLVLEQSNALEQIIQFINSNEQKIRELNESQERTVSTKDSQLTLSKLNQMAKFKNDMITKISSKVQKSMDERFLKIENTQTTLFNISEKVKQEVITIFNSSLDQLVENKLRSDMNRQIDDFQNNISQKLTSIDSQQTQLLSKSHEESNYISQKLKNDENKIGEIQNKINELQLGVNQILKQLEQKADIDTLKVQFNSCFGEQIENINKDIKQINEIRQDQNQIGLSLIEKQKQNVNKADLFEKVMEEKLSSFINEQNKNTDSNDQKKEKLHENVSKMEDKVKQMNEMFLKLQVTKQFYYEQYEKQKQKQITSQLMSVKVENLDSTLLSQKEQDDFDNLMNFSVEDYKKQGSQLKQYSPQKKSNKLNYSQLNTINQIESRQIVSQNIPKQQKRQTQSYLFEDSNSDNLFRYSTATQSIVQSDLQKEKRQNSLSDLQNILIKRVQSQNQKSPLKFSKLIIRQKKINDQTSEDQIKQLQTEDSEEQIEQVSKYPGQEYMTLRSKSRCKQANSFLLTSQASYSENTSNIPEHYQRNNYIRKSLDNFYVPIQKQKTQNQDYPRQSENQPIYLSQYYKLQMIRKSCDLGNYQNNYSTYDNEQQNSKPNCRSSISNYSTTGYYSNQRTNRNSKAEQNCQSESQNNSKINQKRLHFSDLKQESFDSEQYIYTQKYQGDSKLQQKINQSNILSGVSSETQSQKSEIKFMKNRRQFQYNIFSEQTLD